MATKITTDGTRTEVRLPTDQDDHLNAIWDAVGGYFESLPALYEEDAALLVNDNGRVLRLPINQQASKIVGFNIFGDALLVKRVLAKNGCYDYE